MELHQLKPKHKLKKKKRIGRGGKKGTYSGRGVKGQRSRAGRKFQPLIRELIKKYPKLRGYRFNPKARKREQETAVLNLGILEKKFKSQEKITPQLLLEKKLIRRIKGRVPKVKILGDGKLIKSLVIEGCQVSKKTKEKIEKVGGKIL
jgi:large subunit ribosomal protein L15